MLLPMPKYNILDEDESCGVGAISHHLDGFKIGVVDSRTWNPSSSVNLNSRAAPPAKNDIHPTRVRFGGKARRGDFPFPATIDDLAGKPPRHCLTPKRGEQKQKRTWTTNGDRWR